MLINKIELVILFNTPTDTNWHKSKLKWNETKHSKLESLVLETIVSKDIKNRGYYIRGTSLVHKRPPNSSENWIEWDIYYTDEVGLEFIIRQFSDPTLDTERDMLIKILRNSKLDLLMQ